MMIHDENCEHYLKKISFKGTVSQELRWVLLYINQKLFSRADVSHNKNFNFIKGPLQNFKKCPFNRIQILRWATLALEKSFRLIYRNTHLGSRDAVPLK